MISDGWVNLSEIFRRTANKTTGVFKVIGDEIVDMIEEPYDKMLIETPQWSGTTAASWMISLGSRGGFGDGGVNTQRPRTPTEALQKGHLAAVNVSRYAAESEFQIMRKELSAGLGTNFGIIIENNAPGFHMSEFGESVEGGSATLRAVNMPGHQLALFMTTMAMKFSSSKDLLPAGYFRNI